MLECCPWCDMPVQMHDTEEFRLREIPAPSPNPLANKVYPPPTPLDAVFPWLRNYVD